jgi:serine/threonine protein kinase
MRRGPTTLFDNAREPSSKVSLASWYLPGLSDAMGDRLLMFDNTGSPSLELLRFKKEFISKPAFEAALRQRIRQVERLIHPSFGKVRALKWLADNEGLALVSDHVPGRRLSEVLHDARGQGFAMELIRQLTPALVALQQQGDGIAHGLLTPERIVVTPEGNLVIVEHVLGPAVESLDLSSEKLRGELGLALPAGDDLQTLNGRGDVVQLGLIALSLVLGRRIDPADYPHNVGTLLNDFPRVAGRGSSSSPTLRLWLEQALQLRTGAFGSAEDAYVALAGLPDDPAPKPDPRRMLFFRPAEPPPPASVVKAELIHSLPTNRPSERQKHMPPAKWPHSRESTAKSPSIFERVLGRTPAPAPPPIDQSGVPFEIDGQVRFRPVAQAPKPVQEEPAPPAKHSYLHWLTIAVAVVALAEGLFIAGLLYARPAPGAGTGTVLIETTQPGVEVLVDGRPVGATPYKLDVGSGIRSIQVNAADSRIANALLTGSITTVRPKPETVPAAPAPAPGGSLGGVRVTSPIDLQVFEEGRLVGTTAGAMALSNGRHTLEVVNDKLGYRSRYTVEVRPGQTTSLSVTPPNGRVSVNAVPWAEVWIAGSLVGDTPLANLSLPLGEHEIVFRHPQLGERRQTAIVRSDTMTRVTANMQR